MYQPTKQAPRSGEIGAQTAFAAATGDPSALRRLADLLLDRVALTVRYLAGPDPDADDYVQMSMIEILRSVGSFRGESSLETWAEKIAVRTTMRQLKHRRWRGQIVEFDPAPDAVSRAPGADQRLARTALAERLAAHVGTLTPERREVVALRLVLGHSIEEIAELTGAKINTVRDRLAVARRQLRSKIARDPVLREAKELSSWDE
jgi:RNA polymerase sigma-70 factor (ECF subfamily)